MKEHLTELELEQIEEIGAEGRNSKVYIMYDKQLDAKLVVKVIPKADFNGPEDYFKEAKILYASRHPNVMEIHYASMDPDSIYLSMPHYKNGSLNSLIERRSLTVKEIIKYSLGFLSGLHFIHTKGLIHYDIKPTNILINNNDSAVLTDFGLSKYVDEHGMAANPEWYIVHAPPEGYGATHQSVQADIYQAGLTLFRMCNGNKQFRDMLGGFKTLNDFYQAIDDGSFTAQKSYLPHIPTRLIRIVKKALSINPDSRYATPLEMINQIASIDKQTEWKYSLNTDGLSGDWSIPNKNGTHLETIFLSQDDGGWNVSGKKKRVSDDKETNIKAWESTGHDNREGALSVVRKFIKEH